VHTELSVFYINTCDDLQTHYSNARTMAHPMFLGRYEDGDQTGFEGNVTLKQTLSKGLIPKRGALGKSFVSLDQDTRSGQLD
jgi:hypothetical protein